MHVTTSQFLKKKASAHKNPMKFEGGSFTQWLSEIR